MSSFSFNARQGPIRIQAEMTGPKKSIGIELVLDPGATTSVVSVQRLLEIGINPDQPLHQVRLTTGTTSDIVPVVMLTRFSALGHHRFGFLVVAQDLHEEAAADGMLGLDVLRGHRLIIDFRSGQIELQ